MQRSRLKYRKALAAGIATVAALGLISGFSVSRAEAQSTPTTNLGIYIPKESIYHYTTVPGQHPNVANVYLYWGTGFLTQFADEAENHGATPFLEIEPWQGGGPSDCSYSTDFPSMVRIGANGPGISRYLDAFGSAIASFGHPVILTFAHEFNVSGQYPWAHGDCEGTTPKQWIKAWDVVRNDIDSTANGLAYFMWAPNVYTGGSTVRPGPYWPGSSEVDMVGVDGYPNTAYGEQFGRFYGEFGPTFRQIHRLTSLPIFISETDMAPMGKNGYETIPSFVQELCSHGGDGLLNYSAGTPPLTQKQWGTLDSALTTYCGGDGPLLPQKTK